MIFRPDYLKKKEEEEKELAAKKKGESTEVDENKSWFATKLPFVAKYWGIILELTLLLIGILMILITKGGI